MAELENNKDLMSVLWSGADILRSKMDANEYKNYLLGIVFYKYLSDSFLIKAYDLIYDEKPETLKIALDAYKEAVEDESGEELKEEIRSEFHYVIEPELTYTSFAQAANDNSFNREQLQKAFNNIEQSDEIFADLFADIDLYSNRLGTGDQKQSDTVASLIKEIDKADLLNTDAEILGNAYEFLIGQFASETGKKAGEFYTPQPVSKILTKIAINGQEDKRGLSIYDPCMGSGSLLLNAKKYVKLHPGMYKEILNDSTISAKNAVIIGEDGMKRIARNLCVRSDVALQTAEFALVEGKDAEFMEWCYVEAFASRTNAVNYLRAFFNSTDKEKCNKTSNLIFYCIKTRKKDIYLFFFIDL